MPVRPPSLRGTNAPLGKFFRRKHARPGIENLHGIDPGRHVARGQVGLNPEHAPRVDTETIGLCKRDLAGAALKSLAVVRIASLHENVPGEARRARVVTGFAPADDMAP